MFTLSVVEIPHLDTVTVYVPAVLTFIVGVVAPVLQL